MRHIFSRDYGIEIERKAVGRNLSLLKEADFDIISTRNGCYLEKREFEDAELKLLIDGVLCSKHISPHHSKELIEKLAALSNAYFRSHIKNIYTVNDWNKTQNYDLFLNIELVDEAIETESRSPFRTINSGRTKNCTSPPRTLQAPIR